MRFRKASCPQIRHGRKIGSTRSKVGWTAVSFHNQMQITASQLVENGKVGDMRHYLSSALLCGSLSFFGSTCFAQVDSNLAMNKPDELAWQLFIQVNSRAGATNSVFETYASDTDTFQPNPQYPATAVASDLRTPILPSAARQAALDSGELLPAVPPGLPLQGEETRRNKVTFDFIVSNNLHKRSGLKAAFGKQLSFPVDAVEVKANWFPVAGIPQLTNNQVTLAQVPQFYHVNTANDGKQYALLSMHVISKLVPNWTWATFENRFNPGRCDVIGCKDSFGAQTPFVQPLDTPGQIYPDCLKSPALAAMLTSANIEPAYASYCLKGSQSDFVDNVGLDIRVGNSVTEEGFVSSASCMTCHGRAAFKQDGTPASFAGFINPTAPIGPLGPLLPTWYWAVTGQPPFFEGKSGLTRTATPTDFVWSVAFCAIDDSHNPPSRSPCIGK
jgi:hypothetical protein